MITKTKNNMQYKSYQDSKGSFVLNDTTTGARIVDDSNGNLYSTNATFSQSVSNLSSQDNINASFNGTMTSFVLIFF